MIHGIGRKIGFWEDGVHIVEGMFKNDKMCGFARTISYRWSGDYIVTLGNFNKREERNGYFRIYYTQGVGKDGYGIKESFFQNGKYKDID